MFSVGTSIGSIDCRVRLMNERSSGPSLVAREAQEICQQLLRIDTTNPPGNERPAAELLSRLLEEVGYEPVILEAERGRANLVCRRAGTGAAAPLLLSAHLDVVEARAGKWKRPPFSGAEADGGR